MAAINNEPGRDAARVADALSKRIAATGMKEAQFARLIGVPTSTFGRIANGDQLPSVPIAIAIARYFRCSVADIFCPDGEPWAEGPKLHPATARFIREVQLYAAHTLESSFGKETG